MYSTRYRDVFSDDARLLNLEHVRNINIVEIVGTKQRILELPPR